MVAFQPVQAQGLCRHLPWGENFAFGGAGGGFGLFFRCFLVGGFGRLVGMSIPFFW